MYANWESYEIYDGGGWVYHLFIYLFISAGTTEW